MLDEPAADTLVLGIGHHGKGGKNRKRYRGLGVQAPASEQNMTDGVVTVLGPTGVNFGAGMTGGFAYVLDIDRRFVDRYNHELIDIHRINSESLEAHLHHLRAMIMRHVEATASTWGQQILDDYRTFLPKFWLVKPKAAEITTLIESLRQAA